MRRNVALTLLVAFAFGAMARNGDATAPLQAEDSSVPAYVAAHPLLDLIPENESVPVHMAKSALRVGLRLGVGSCMGDHVVAPELFVLDFSGKPAQACGSGWFSSHCASSWQNCVATKWGIICDHDYLARLYLLQRIVLSTQRNNPSTGPAIPTDAMLRIAHFAENVESGLPVYNKIKALMEKYPWTSLGRQDDVEQMLAETGIIQAVLLHELAHVEQASCALGHEDPRYLDVRDLLEEVSCRTLIPKELRADMRALDVGASIASQIRGFHQNDLIARSLHLRAVVARLEYEAMILPNPQYAAEVYSNEPQEPTLLWDYYLNAGRRYPTYTGSGHIPPELRPIAALRLLQDRGFLGAGGDTLAFRFAGRLRPFLVGLLLARCKYQGEFAIDGMRELLDLVMFGRDTLR